MKSKHARRTLQNDVVMCNSPQIVMIYASDLWLDLHGVDLRTHALYVGIGT